MHVGLTNYWSMGGHTFKVLGIFFEAHMPTLHRRAFLQTSGALAALAHTALSFSADTLPAGPVKVIVPYGPGGIGDYTGRLLSQFLAKQWPATSLVENRAGASGLIGGAYVKNAKPDGNTILMTSNTTISAAPLLFKNVGYDPSKDFVHLGILGVFGSVALVPPGAPFKTIPELVAYVKKNPQAVFYAYTNASSQVPPEMLNARAGIKLTGVPYKESGRAIGDLMAGQVQVMFMDYVAATPHIAGGKVVPLAVTQQSRHAVWPQVPTMAEFYPGYEMSGYVAVSAPAGMPASMVAAYNDLIRAAVQDATVRDKLAAQGLQTRDFDLASVQRFIDAETAKWGDYVKIADIKPE